MRRRNKRGQMEIMGLVIIIVLIIIGVLFGIRFVIKKEPPSLAQEFRQTRLAANLLSSMLGTTTPCHDTTVTQLLQDCAIGGGVRCSTSTGTQNSCDFVDGVISTMLGLTLETWRQSYYFSIKGPTRVQAINYGWPEDVVDNKGCLGEREFKMQPIPSRAGVLSLRLEICR